MCPSVSNRGGRRGEPLSSTRRSHIHIQLLPTVSLFNLPLLPTCFHSLFLSLSPMCLSSLPTSYCHLIIFFHFLSGLFNVPHRCLSFSLPISSSLLPPLSLRTSFHVHPISQMNLLNGPSICATEQSKCHRDVLYVPICKQKH